MFRILLLVLVLGTTLALAIPALADESTIHSEPIVYAVGETELNGILYYDASYETPRPGVLVVHEWWGVNEHAKTSAERLAKAGYVAFALDMYGEGRVTEHAQEAMSWAGQVQANSGEAKARFQAAYDLLAKNELVAPGQIAAIGYCFGGNQVLVQAQQGADLAAVVSFHGLPPTDKVAKGKVKAQVLVCHGAEDPFVTQEQLDTFTRNMEAAAADFGVVVYEGAKHSFTVPTADARGIDGLAYNEKAAKASWKAMLHLLEEAFATE